MTDHQMSLDAAIEKWLPLVKKELEEPQEFHEGPRHPYTLLVSRRKPMSCCFFTLAIYASNPITAISDATQALNKVPMPPEFDGEGPLTVGDVYYGHVDLRDCNVPEEGLYYFLVGEFHNDIYPSRLDADNLPPVAYLYFR